MTIIIGATGTGKSTLFDVFSFLKDSLAGKEPWRGPQAQAGAF